MGATNDMKKFTAGHIYRMVDEEGLNKVCLCTKPMVSSYRGKHDRTPSLCLIDLDTGGLWSSNIKKTEGKILHGGEVWYNITEHFYDTLTVECTRDPNFTDIQVSDLSLEEEAT